MDVGSLTDEGLAEIDDLLDSATPGPWYVRLLDDDFSMNIVAVSTVSREGAPGSFPDFKSIRNRRGDFGATSRLRQY